MAKIDFKRTHDVLISYLIVGVAVGATIGLIASGQKGPDYFVITLMAVMVALPFGLAGYFTKTYKLSCSNCGSDITKFSESQSDGKIFYCPMCGEKFGGDA